MHTNVRSLLKKAASLSQHLSVVNGYAQWPENVLSYLENKFHLRPNDMVYLRCVIDRKSRNGIPVNFIRIFDRTKSYEQGVIIKRYHDLDRHPELVLFEGHILRNGTVYLNKKKEFITAA
ncbi:hypothetical protein ACFLUN_01305 [Chloroflexota bacterium]